MRGVLASVLGNDPRGRDPHRGGDGPRHRVLPNDLWPGYKTGEGIDPDLFAQFQLLEDALAAAGVAVWPMVEFEADDALASAAARPPAIRGSIASSSARPIRTSRNASAARVSFS